MEELPITFHDVGEPPDNVNIEESSSPELDAEIESHVEALERRDAGRFSDRVGHIHRGPERPRHNDGRQSRRTQHCQRRQRRNDDDGQDEQPHGRVGSLRAGLILSIVLTVISVVAVAVLFATDSGGPTPPPNIEIKTRQPTLDSYITLQPPPPLHHWAPVKQTPLRLPKRTSN